MDGKVYSIGGPRAVTPELRSRILGRMKAWAVLAQEVVKAEHPDFELVRSFRIFDLEKLPEQSVDDIMRGGRTKVYDHDLGRLASTFDVDPNGLAREFWDYSAVALIQIKMQMRKLMLLVVHLL